MNEISILLAETYLQRPIGYFRVYTQISGSVNGGVALSQLIYWAVVSEWREFYKTNKELRDETGLTRTEFENVKLKLKSLPFMEIETKGLPNKTYYTVNRDTLIEAIDSSLKTCQPDALIPDNQLPGNLTTGNNERGKQVSLKPDNIHKTTTKNIYSVFEYWNAQKIIIHKDVSKFRGSIKAALKFHEVEDINGGIKNYKDILESSEHYFSHEWTLKEFLSRSGGLDKFIDRKKAFKNFKNKSNGRRTQADINSAKGKLVV